MINVGVIDSSVRIRDAKEIIAMNEVHGNKVKFFFMKTLNVPGNQGKIPGLTVNWINPAKPPMQKNILNLCKKNSIDILHTHNYPDNYGAWGLNIREQLGIPVVHECHDIGYENVKPGAAEVTSRVMKKSDKIITVSTGMTEYLHNMYGVRNKCTVIYPYPNKKFIPKTARSIKPDCKHGVYQGGINFNNNPGGKYNHRYYKNIFKKLVQQGVTIDIYPAHPSGKANYGYPRIRFRRNIPDVSKLYRILSQYDWGFIGYNQTKSVVMDIAMPNKLFEYIGCGIPIIAMNYNLIGKFVNNHEFGIVVNKNTIKLPKNYHKILIKAKKNIIKNRMKYTMESQINKLMNIYESVI